MTLHEFLDFHYGPDGDEKLQQRILGGEDLRVTSGKFGELPLHVAVRRRRMGKAARGVAGNFAGAVEKTFEAAAEVLFR